MKGLGGLLLFFGIGSFVLNYLGREFALLMWVDNWGPEVGLGIRIGAIVLGIILFFVGMSMEKTESQA